MNGLENSIFTIAPERKNEAQTALDNFDLIYSPGRPWEAYALPRERQIFLSRGAVELMWCASLAHFLFYTRLIQGRSFEQHVNIDPGADPEVKSSLELLRWALKCKLERSNADDWPANLPQPVETPTSGSNEEVADEVCRASLAYILHHEVAHVRLQHIDEVPDDQSVSREKEADIEAADWILDGLTDPGDPRFTKRMLGIAQAMVVLMAFDLYGGNFFGRRHPFSYDRLSSVLSRHLGDESHVARTFAFSVTLLHLNNSGRTLNQNSFNSFSEGLEAICNQLADEVARRSAESGKSF